MPARNATKHHLQIDWLASNLRWLLLLAAALVVFLDTVVSHSSVLALEGLLTQILLLVAAVAYNLVVTLLLSREPVSRGLSILTLLFDTLFTIGLILSTGGLSSPLLFLALFPILTAALRLARPMNLLVAPALVTMLGIAVYALAPPEAWSDLVPFAVFSVVLLGAAAISSYAAEEVKRIVSRRRRRETESERRKLRAAREQSRLTFELASTLSATLNYNRVLRAVLEVGEQGMQELSQKGGKQVGMVLLFAHNDLRIAASRHLSSRDRATAFAAKEGALAEALDTAEAVVVEDPVADPELGRLISLHTCEQAVVVPLRAGFESFGVTVFGSSEPNVYTRDLVNLLTAICNQAIVALQNAQLYQNLREEKERIVAVEEDARKKLARNLHDGPTQNIASIAMQVNFVRNLIERSGESEQVAKELKKIEALARRTTKQIRYMLFTLRPLILETQGLGAALEQYIVKIEETDDTNIILEAETEAEQRLDKEAQGIVFYIVEEAVSNARKHAKAGCIWIRLYRGRGEAVVAEVEDDGLGFDVGAVQMTYDRRGSLGLITMHERAEMTGGELTIASAPGEGTQVRLIIPSDGRK